MPAATGMGAGLEKLEDVVAVESCTVEQVCYELSRIFRVRAQEVALLQVQRSMLKFLYPAELRSAGAIPMSSSAIAARTAASRRSDYFNNFVSVQHSSIFENVKMRGSDAPNSEMDPHTIQKLMSAPVMGAGGKVAGVIQISRKGFDLISCGPDFTSEDIEQLKAAAKVIGIFLARQC
ncbi:MAG TPA: GAF domain-containing protein [Terriglobales bacterium]|nr:GAF domain-containing protein [Terriglobales bacterium]